MSAQARARLHRIQIYFFDDGWMMESMEPLPNGEIGARAETQKVHKDIDGLLGDLRERMESNEQVKRAMRMAGAGFELPDGKGGKETKQ